jgi:hypothetical protein
MNYDLVSPENFTEEQENFLESVKKSVNIVFSNPGIILGIKDINSKHIISTDYFAILGGLSHGEEVEGRFDRDFPCKTAEFAQDFVDEDSELLSHKDINRQKSILSVSEYATGMKSLLVTKYLLGHVPSKSILGIMFTANEIDLSYFLTALPNYLYEFGGGSIQNINEALKIGDIHLTTYEHEVGFLIAMNWDPEHIASFMNKHQPHSIPQTTDIIDKCQDEICQKLNCQPSHLRDKLIDLALHKKMPDSFFHQLIGNRSLS